MSETISIPDKSKMWLRKYDHATQSFTNQCFPYNDELAKESNFRLIDADEAKKCAAALLEEKRLAVQKRLMDRAIEKPVITPAMNKQDSPGQGMEVPKTMVDVEAVAKEKKPPAAEDVLAELEKADPAPESVSVRVDDLDGMGRDELRNVIDGEGLDVKKNLSVAEMLPLVRAARKAKVAAETATEG